MAWDWRVEQDRPTGYARAVGVDLEPMMTRAAVAQAVRAAWLSTCAALPAASVATLPVAAVASPRDLDNVLPVTVRTPHGGFNRFVVSVTVCEPGTTQCATIDDVMLDTGSTDLRLEASAVPAWISLPAHRDQEGRPLSECLHFVHDDAWGPVVRSDLHLGGLMAKDVPLQVISDDGRPQPAACPRSTERPTSNGTLGIGPNLFDCPGTCEQNATRPTYFVGGPSTWTPVAGRLAPTYRVPNPVARLPAHNNGVVFDLPSPPGGDAREVVGALMLGVGTAPNNQPGPASRLPLDAAGRFTTTYRGRSYPESTIDSGSETDIIEDDQLPRCAGMAWAFCPTPDRWIEAAMAGPAGARFPWRIRVGNYRRTLTRNDGASDGMVVAASEGTRSFVWGAPFFMGKRVMVVFEGRDVPRLEHWGGPLYGIQDTARPPTAR